MNSVPETLSRVPLSYWLALGVAGLSLIGVVAIELSESSGTAPPQTDEIRLLDAPAPVNHQNRSDSAWLGNLAPISVAQAIPHAAHPPLAPLPQPQTEAQPAPASDDSTTTTTTPPAEASDTVALDTRILKVRPGDSLSLLFERNGFTTKHWFPLSKLDGEGKRLRRLQPGDELELQLDPAGEIANLRMRRDEFSWLSLARHGNRYDISISQDKIETRTIAARGTVEDSLYLSGQRAGLTDRLIMELAGIFAWDIDFVLDIRGNEDFTVVYEDLYRNGERLREGKILAAQFQIRGRTLRAVRYTDDNGRSAYYAPDGTPMQKAFLRNPVDFTRISSRFSLGRKHPILNKIRAHRGVDYAAARGTPVKSAGAGKVIFAGRKGGYGNVVIIQHGGKYQTLYAHLDKFRRGIRRGRSVNQGQTIAYVGSTGLATGPHLHYEFRVHGEHVDPLRVKLPQAPKIASSKLPQFEAQTAELLAQLEQASKDTVVAAAEPILTR